jgi:hypothetical protein
MAVMMIIPRVPLIAVLIPNAAPTKIEIKERRI